MCAVDSGVDFAMDEDEEYDWGIMYIPWFEEKQLYPLKWFSFDLLAFELYSSTSGFIHWWIEYLIWNMTSI